MLLFTTKNTTHTKAKSFNEDEQAIEETILYIEWLMRWYAKQRTLLMASIIVSRLEFLRQCYLDGKHNQCQWACERLLRNWEYIADRQRARVC